MANQHGNGQNGFRTSHHRYYDDRRDTDYRGMGQSGYGSGFDRAEDEGVRYSPSPDDRIFDYEHPFPDRPQLPAPPRGSNRGKGPKGFAMSDDRVRERVCEALSEDHDVDASDIEVSVASGDVTLIGTVEDRASKRMAEDCVLQCAGVRDVHNQLRVRR